MNLMHLDLFVQGHALGTARNMLAVSAIRNRAFIAVANVFVP